MPDSSSADDALRPEPQGETCWLGIDVVEDADVWAEFPSAEALAGAASRLLARHARFEGEAPALACVALSSDAAVRELNRQYRGKDKATNVLSFPAPEMPGEARGDEGARGPEPLGDIVIAYETVKLEAAEQGLDLADHFQHLVVHGLLHLLGFDHETDAEAAEMEGLEIEILASLGIQNPYTEELDRHVS